MSSPSFWGLKMTFHVLLDLGGLDSSVKKNVQTGEPIARTVAPDLARVLVPHHCLTVGRCPHVHLWLVNLVQFHHPTTAKVEIPIPARAQLPAGPFMTGPHNRRLPTLETTALDLA